MPDQENVIALGERRPERISVKVGGMGGMQGKRETGGKEQAAYKLRHAVSMMMDGAA